MVRFVFESIGPEKNMVADQKIIERLKILFSNTPFAKISAVLDQVHFLLDFFI